MTTDTTLVVGATGKTGRRVAARLRRRGVPVRAASRSSATPSTGPTPPAGMRRCAASAPSTWCRRACPAQCTSSSRGPRPPACSAWCCSPGTAPTPGATVPLSSKEITPAEYTAALVEQGVSEDDAHHVTEMFVLMARGLIAGTTDELATILRRAPRTFEDDVARIAPTGAGGR